MSESSQPSLSTIAVTAGRPARSPDAPLNVPIVPASTFVAGGLTEYAREGNPTVQAFEEVISSLECPDGGSAFGVAFSSGMAAANAILDTVPTHGRVIAPSTAYAGVAKRLEAIHDRGLIDLVRVDVVDSSAVLAEIEQGGDLLWLESPTNPLLEEADLPVLLSAAQAAGVRSVVDNTFATPVLQRPLTAGADVVLHSATKALSGHSDLLMGVTVCAAEDMATNLRGRRSSMGSMPSAFDAFLAARGIRTLAVRMERACRNATFLAEQLSAHAVPTNVRSFGSLISCEMGGDVEIAERLGELTTVWVHATSLGGVESSLERRRRWANEALHVPEDLVRFSVGIEDPVDLWADLEQALDRL